LVWEGVGAKGGRDQSLFVQIGNNGKVSF